MCNIDDSEIELKFHDLCRLCASYDSNKISLFGDEGKRRQLKKKIQFCFPFKVDENDALPKSLCLACTESLENTFQFRDKCMQVNRSLEKYLSKREKEKLEKTSSNQSHRIRPEVSIFAIPPTGQTSSNQNANEASSLPTDSEDGPNPLDFLEVGVNAEDNVPNANARFNNNKKQQFGWNANKPYLSVEQRKWSAEQKAMELQANAQYADGSPSSTDVESLNRRKNNNPRKIAREMEEGMLMASVPASTTPRTPGLIAINIAPPIRSTVPAKGTLVSVNDMKQASRASVIASQLEASSDDKQTYSCLLCEQSFTQRTALNQHFSGVHGIEPYAMLAQHSSFGDTDGLDDELAESMVEQEVIIFCEVCRREFQDRASLWLHMVHAHREEASLSCGICLKICSDSITLIEHVNTEHSGDNAVVQRRYSCQVCGRQHDSRQKLIKHAALHTLIDNTGKAIEPQEMISLNSAYAQRDCPICHRRFFNQEKYDHHMQNFHNDSHEHPASTPSVIYKCELCASSHATRIDRWWHMYHSHSGDERVTCLLPTCLKVFVTQALKDEHCKAHHEAQGEFTNTCEICGKLWESRTVFYKHMMNVHPKCLPTICGICMKIFSNVPELRNHVRSEHPPLEESAGICCDVCGRSYAERSKMLRHRRVHNVTDGVPFTPSMIKKKDDLQCSVCPEIPFETLEEISEHRRSVHQLFVCDLCPKFYNGNNHLWKHVSKQHKGDPAVTCDICLRTSASRAHLYRHKLKYHSDPVERLIARAPGDPVPQVHKCPLCGREFRIRSLLKKHSKSCKGIKPPVQKVQPVNGVFPCSKCGKVFEQQGVLSKHMRNSHITHFCEACPDVEPKVGFEKKSDLLQHIREQHANDPELVCDVDGCGKVLRVKADLQKHKLEHSRGYFTYICDCCGDMFSNRKKLRKHLITFHKSDVQHLCGVCIAILPSIPELAEHVQVNHPALLHRPFTCQICGKCWSVTSKTVDHITKVHGPEYKPCKICWKIFTVEKELDEHVENHPPMEEKPATPVVKKEPTTPRVRPAKSSFHNELTALGIDYDGGILGKRAAEDDLEMDDVGGKRLRKKYKCSKCKDTFRSLLELNEHIPECNGNQVSVKSEEGDEDDRSMEAYEEEKEIDPKTERWTDINPIACDCCSKVWNSKKQLWQHLIRSHIPQSMHTCGICLRVCENYYDLFYHLDAQHSNALNDSAARFACSVCGHYHNSQSKLEKHITVHKNAPQPTEYKCPYCQRNYRSVVYYREHIRVHESVERDRNVPKMETSEFSGFSINSILQKTVDEDVEDEHEDDIECEGIEDDDDDMVELENDDNDDSDLDASNVKETSSHDGRVFRGYENVYGQLPQSSKPTAKEKFAFEGIPPHFRSKQDEDGEAQEMDETMDEDLESNISCSTLNSTSEIQDEDEDMVEKESVLNGSQESSDENHGSSYGGVNNNQQKQERRLGNVDEKRNFRNSNGDNYFKRMTE